MNTGPSGFHNAPVTRAIVVASAIFTVISGVGGRSAKLGVSYQDIFKKFDVGKLISFSFAFSSTPELMFGLYLLYYFRVFERQIGSNKYSVFILFSLVVATMFQIISLVLLKDPAFGAVVSGPYGLIFSSFVPFYFDIPVSSRFHVLGFPFSDKSFIYLAGLQLILSSWKRSLFPGICGIFAGLLYRLNIFYIRKIKFPDAVASFFSHLPLSSTRGSSTISRGNVSRTAAANIGQRLDGNYPTSARRFSSEVEPSEYSIATLESMGFDRGAATQALIRARNDLNVATNMLLEAQSHS